MALDAYFRAGLRLNPLKCHFFKDQVDFLGHTVNAEGVQPTQSYVQKVKDFKFPQNRKELRGFLGLVNYYRRHIKDLAAIAKPLTDQTAKTEEEKERDKRAKEQAEKRGEKWVPVKKNDSQAPVQRTPEAQNAFETLKTALTSAPILGHPTLDGKDKFILDTDYSGDQVGPCSARSRRGKRR